MRTVKVYDKTGTVVDSFNKIVAKNVEYKHCSRIRALNRVGYYVRSQFSHSGKTLMRSY